MKIAVLIGLGLIFLYHFSKALVQAYPINYERKLKQEKINLGENKPGNIGRLVKIIRLNSKADKSFIICIICLIIAIIILLF